MSLPPGFLDELRNRISLAQVVGRKVMWDARRSNQGKGDMWAPCPFHQEKTASFHVDDRKGFYYCFGCHAKGDVLTFIRQTENVGFMEAVEILAREAGMTLPAPDPQARQKADRRTELTEVMERAVRFYRRQLAGIAGADARDYLVRRGLSEAAQERFSIGYAPNARQGLIAHLTEAGVPADLVIDAGLAARDEGGGAPYDRFRDRIIFPIRDAREACIALGGRAMDPNARAKYYNSPETELFDKGRGLYNIAPARVASGKGAALIVAEGYMDVIALSEAGFGAAVAPLGTAITEDQLRLMWRIADEPVITLDGDTAGLKAAMRLVDLALPLLAAGKSLRFCILPANMDPDDVIRTQGAAAMQKLVDQAQPMVDLLWRRETEGRVFDSPERKAALERALSQATARITDPILKKEYDQALRDLRWQAFRPRRAKGAKARTWGGPGGFAATSQPALPATRASLLGTGGEAVEERLHEAVILAVLITHPALIGEFIAPLEMLEPQDRDHRALWTVLLGHHDIFTDSAALKQKLRATAGDALEKLFALGHVQIAPPVRHVTDRGLARLCLAEEFARLSAQRGARREVAEAEEDLAGLADEGVTWRLSQAAEARYMAQRPVVETQDMGEDRAAMSRALQNFIDQEVWVKKKG